MGPLNEMLLKEQKKIILLWEINLAQVLLCNRTFFQPTFNVKQVYLLSTQIGRHAQVSRLVGSANTQLSHIKQEFRLLQLLISFISSFFSATASLLAPGQDPFIISTLVPGILVQRWWVPCRPRQSCWSCHRDRQWRGVYVFILPSPRSGRVRPPARQGGEIDTDCRNMSRLMNRLVNYGKERVVQTD